MFKSLNRIFSPRVNLTLYSMLLLITPFLMLQNYLQDAIGMLSEWSFMAGGIKIPWLVTILIVFIAIMLYRFRRKTTLKTMLVWAIILLMWIIGQQTSDYYLDIPFYQLQHNWHYFAYGIFSFVAYQLFSAKQKTPAAIILRVFFMAMLISTFDEMAQVFISSRTFDISDIAKDLWGVLMGVLFLYFIYNNPSLILKKGWIIRERKFGDYLKNPVALVAWMMVFTYILLFVSSALTESKYAFNVVFITLLVFLVIFFIIHLTRTRTEKIVFGILAGLLIIILSVSIARNHYRNITDYKQGLLVYKGVPIPFFDVMILENGCFRVVDKKEFFNQTDIRFLFKKASNILLIGSGKEVKSRMGFPEDAESQFIFNRETGRGLQVIILPTEEACKVFNRLKKEEKEVMFIIHSN